VDAVRSCGLDCLALLKHATDHLRFSQGG
jgi:hypothetical protein